MHVLHQERPGSQGGLAAPAWWTAFQAVGVSEIASIVYLTTRDLRWDGIAVATSEVGLVFLAMGLTLGSIWGRVIWGIWWTWDARLTSTALVLVRLEQEELSKKIQSLAYAWED